MQGHSDLALQVTASPWDKRNSVRNPALLHALATPPIDVAPAPNVGVSNAPDRLGKAVVPRELVATLRRDAQPPPDFCCGDKLPRIHFRWHKRFLLVLFTKINDTRTIELN